MVDTYIPHDLVHNLRYHHWMTCWTITRRPNIVCGGALRVTEMAHMIWAVQIFAIPACRKGYDGTYAAVAET